MINLQQDTNVICSDTKMVKNRLVLVLSHALVLMIVWTRVVSV